MTHDKKCKLGPKRCHECELQREARDDEAMKWAREVNILRSDLQNQRKATWDNFNLLQKLTRKTGNNA